MTDQTYVCCMSRFNIQQTIRKWHELALSVQVKLWQAILSTISDDSKLHSHQTVQWSTADNGATGNLPASSVSACESKSRHSEICSFLLKVLQVTTLKIYSCKLNEYFSLMQRFKNNQFLSSLELILILSQNGNWSVLWKNAYWWTPVTLIFNIKKNSKIWQKPNQKLLICNLCGYKSCN